MKSPLRILHLEDSPKDAALVRATMEAEGIPCTTTCVQGRAAFVAALEEGGIDLVLSDYSLPTFDGLSAVTIVHDRWPDLPIILVSGTLGEELAIDAMKSGATDYVLKERLVRLVPAVRRAMQTVEEKAERGRLEAQLIESQKMEVIGHLAAGVAHDFNNILAVIMGYGDLLTHFLDKKSPLRAYTKEIRIATERAAGLTRQLLLFSRKQTVQPVVLDLREVINELAFMLRRLVDENIVMTVVTGDTSAPIAADPGYIGQVVMNLVVNARDAMPAGGTLNITIKSLTLPGDGAPPGPGMAPGDYVELSIRDDGAGMTEEVKARLFEPFFTTKPAGKGTGLGLPICQTIVQLSGGHIIIDSVVGHGTNIRILFPRVVQAVEVGARPPPPNSLPRGRETLMVVEDEPAVRHLAARLLEGQGYTVLSAANGRDGLRAANEHQGSPISLVISDVMMPMMGGKVMAEWLKSTYPGLKVLFTSGYTEDSIAALITPGAGMEFLAKPYSSAALSCKVREMLDRKNEPVT